MKYDFHKHNINFINWFLKYYSFGKYLYIILHILILNTILHVLAPGRYCHNYLLVTIVLLQFYSNNGIVT